MTWPTSQRYYPYGAQRGMGEVNTPYRYTGQKWEANDALEVYYYKARWYDPALRRFLQPDTIVPEPGNPQNLNRYSYAANGPISNNDPTGHDAGINPVLYPQANPWWLGVPMPSHYLYRPGGMYGWGTMQLGARSVSLYLPPTVYDRSTVKGKYEIYPSRRQETMLRPYPEFIEDCMECGYYGEGSVWVAQESWQTIYERTETHYWSALDPVAGALYGMGDSPDLPLPDDAPRAEVVAEAIGLLGPGAEGAVNMLATNTMILQKNRYGTIRMIYITNLKGVGQPNYVTAQGLHSVTDRRAIESLSLEETRVRIVERW